MVVSLPRVLWRKTRGSLLELPLDHVQFYINRCLYQNHVIAHLFNNKIHGHFREHELRRLKAQPRVIDARHPTLELPPAQIVDRARGKMHQCLLGRSV